MSGLHDRTGTGRLGALIAALMALSPAACSAPGFDAITRFANTYLPRQSAATPRYAPARPYRSSGASTGAGVASRNPAAEAPSAAEASQPAVFRVAADGTMGCADLEALQRLRILEQEGEIDLRLAARLRREGGCVTAFRVNEWLLMRQEPGAVQLRLRDEDLVLFFPRSEVVEVASAATDNAP